MVIIKKGFEKKFTNWSHLTAIRIEPFYFCLLATLNRCYSNDCFVFVVLSCLSCSLSVRKCIDSMKDSDITKFLVSFTGQIEYVTFPGGVFDDQLYVQYETVWGPDWEPVSGLTSGTSQMARSGVDPERVVLNLPLEMVFSSTNVSGCEYIVQLKGFITRSYTHTSSSARLICLFYRATNNNNSESPEHHQW